MKNVALEFITPAALSSNQKKVQANFFNSANKPQFNGFDKEDHHALSATLQPNFSFYRKHLLQQNPMVLSFLRGAEQESMRETLLLAYYQLCAQFKLNEIENRKEARAGNESDIKRCALLLQALNDSSSSGAHPNQTKYTPFFEKIYGSELTFLKKAPLVYSLNQMGWLNGWRFYWIWLSLLIPAVVAMMPSNFFNIKQTQQAMNVPDSFFKYMSVWLYALRFCVNLFLMMKHVVAPSAEEKEMLAWQERLATQWNQRKFVMANDAVWGVVNGLTNFWLIGSGLLGFIGNLSLIGLLLVDLSLTVKRCLEAFDAHDVQAEAMHDEIRAIEKLLAQSTNTPDQNTKFAMQLELAHRNQAQLALDWKYKKQQLLYDVSYSVSLVVSFFVFVGCLTSLAVSPLFVLYGAILLFAGALLYTGASGQLNVNKCNAEADAKLALCITLLTDRINNKSNLSEADKLLLEQYQNQAAHLKSCSTHERLKMARNVFIQTFTPVVIFTAFTFLTAGAGIGVLAAFMALAIITDKLLKYIEKDAPSDVESSTMSNDKLVEKRYDIVTKMHTKPRSVGHRSFFSSSDAKNDNNSVTEPLYTTNTQMVGAY